MLALSGALITCACAVPAGAASGQSLQERLNATQDRLSHASAHEGVLTSRISHESRQLERLTAQVATLRNREAAVAAQLAQKQAELDQAQARLTALKQRLRKAIQILEQRLVAIYESNEPDLITVILQSHGFDDIVARTQYLRNLQDQDNEIISRVRELRNEMQATVNTVRAARDAIAAQKQELAATRSKLEARTSELATARRRQHETLVRVRSLQDDLEGIQGSGLARLSRPRPGFGVVALRRQVGEGFGWTGTRSASVRALSTGTFSNSYVTTSSPSANRVRAATSS